MKKKVITFSAKPSKIGGGGLILTKVTSFFYTSSFAEETYIVKLAVGRND